MCGNWSLPCIGPSANLAQMRIIGRGRPALPTSPSDHYRNGRATVAFCEVDRGGDGSVEVNTNKGNQLGEVMMLVKPTLTK